MLDKLLADIIIMTAPPLSQALAAGDKGGFSRSEASRAGAAWGAVRDITRAGEEPRHLQRQKALG
jgi:hypothetical protein